MNWYRLKESIKYRRDRVNAFLEETINLGALNNV